MTSNEKIYMPAKDIKEGRYLLIEDIPCRVVEVESSKSGKHGGAKMRITGMGLFGGEKKTLLAPGDSDVEVPIIERRNAQIMSITGKSAQVMDTQTYEIFNIELPDDIASQAVAGKEVEILEAMGRRKVERLR
jgi:translation initiation factor 5A